MNMYSVSSRVVLSEVVKRRLACANAYPIARATMLGSYRSIYMFELSVSSWGLSSCFLFEKFW
jgi:hypothetical protein